MLKIYTRLADHKWICDSLARYSSLCRLLELTLTIAIAGSLSACSSFGSHRSRSTGRSNSRSSSSRVHQLERIVETQRNELDNFKEKNLVLGQRLQKKRLSEAPAPNVAATVLSVNQPMPVAFDPSAATSPNLFPRDVSAKGAAIAGSQKSSVPTMLPPARKTVYVHAALEPAAPQNGRGLAIPVVSVPVTPVPHQLPLQIVAQEQTGEHFLYSKILESYRTQDSASLQKTLQLLLKTYADSVFADNAMYLAGLLSIEQNDLPRARYYFDRLVKQFPHGNKVVAALFATAVVEKKSRNFARSRIFFERVARLFPGSPEAGRVQLELKLLKSEEQQNGRGA